VATVIPWRIAVFVLLGLVLAGGFAWYEWSRPPSRIVALVAALAALAVAGRLAFAAVPNVQATTDIVLITGYAVGAAPGFAVGALAALVSNFWMGEGPWTPWQMAGWGLVGLGGAGLATLTRHRLGRFGLAGACGLAGLAYGALLEYSVMATSGGVQSLDRYLAICARGIPFDVAHAVGNVALALAAGPALVRMLNRYRERFEWTWRRERVIPVALAILVTASLGAAPVARARGATSSLAWLAQARNDDGGYGVTGGSRSSSVMTGWAMLGLEAAGRNPLDIGRKAKTPAAYLRQHASAIRSTGDLERTILALEGAGINPRSFAGRDLVAQLNDRRRKNGSYDGQVNLTAFGILALRAAGRPVHSLRRSRRWLEASRNHDGGWGFERGVASDADSTGATLEALAVSGAGEHALGRGVHYLRRDQNADGGWPLNAGGPSNSQSTAWAIQGLIGAGVNPAATRSGGRSGFDYLKARRARDGHYRYSKSSDQTPVWVTSYALMAVRRQALPIAAVARAPKPQNAGGGESRGEASGGGSVGSSTSGPGAQPASGSGSPATVGAAPPLATSNPKRPRGRKGASPHAEGRSALQAPAAAHTKSTSVGNSRVPGGPPATTTPASSSSSDSGLPVWAYAAGGLALVALIWAVGVWWYRSGGWVPSLPGRR
jgi:energy-coupling factor transport system substrate-specific component